MDSLQPMNLIATTYRLSEKMLWVSSCHPAAALHFQAVLQHHQLRSSNTAAPGLLSQCDNYK